MFGIVLKVIRRTKKKLRQDLEANMKVCSSLCMCSRLHTLWLWYRCNNIVASQDKTEPTLQACVECCCCVWFLCTKFLNQEFRGSPVTNALKTDTRVKSDNLTSTLQ